MSEKYELVKSDTKEFMGKTLFRVKALKDFSIFKMGELGGYIEKEDNLSQEGDAWVSGNAWVFGDARVSGNAWVFGKLEIDFILCSRFSFGFDWQIKKWRKLEKQFEKELKNHEKVRKNE